MIFRSIAALNEYDIAVLNIYPVVGHRATSERLCQSRYSGGVSNPGLMVNINKSERPGHSGDEPALLIVNVGASHMGDVFNAIDHLAFAVLRNEAGIAGLL